MSKPGYVGMRAEAPPLTPTGQPRNTAEEYHRGRPSTYKPEYCQQLMEAAEEGLSLTSFAGRIKVSLETLGRWSANFPEFREAVKTSKAIRTLALEKQLLTSTKQPKVTAMIFALKNAAPHEFRDKVEVENTSSNTANPLTQVFTSLVQSAGGAVGSVTAFAGVRFEQVAGVDAGNGSDSAARDVKTIDARVSDSNESNDAADNASNA
jgi:hypothetical protein